SPNPLRLLMTENGGAHEEVLASLIYAFAQLPNSYMYQYLLRPRFNIEAIVEGFGLNNVARHRLSKELVADASDFVIPDILIAATCENDIANLRKRMQPMLGNGTHLFCTIHHTDRWNSTGDGKFNYNAIKEWVRAQQVTFLFLSPHTRDTMIRDILPTWDEEDRFVAEQFQVFVPVFPLPGRIPSAPENVISRTVKSEGELSFSMQGNYESDRRDYEGVFKELEEYHRIQAARASDSDLRPAVKLHLIGSGRTPEVPADIEQMVVFDTRLQFPEYYELLSYSSALLPAFATEGYYYTKASSTVPASLIAGAPLICQRRLMDTYAYLTEDVVWVQEEGETEFDVVSRITNLPLEAISERKERAYRRNMDLVQENVRSVQAWSSRLPYDVQRAGNEPLRENWEWYG
ncbi:uncharacterized protein V1516DRAFT_626977, partial [Lipomyces oligophaga]|uniref:uncharacterized protein n=1 Tax=Lipomyces oligophaga TaxID=45792 RepID=UPI0034CF2662